MREDLGAARLVGDDGWAAHLHGLQWRYTEWLAHAWHDIHIRVSQHLLYLSPAHETWEVELIRYAALCHEVNHFVHHIAATCHHEAHAICLCQYACCGLHEVLWTFLHGDTAEEGHQLVFALMLHELLGVSQWLYGIVHGAHFVRGLTVFFNHGAACQFAHAHDVVCLVHTAFLDGIYGRIDIAAAAVEVCSVHVYHEWLARYLLRKHTRWVCQPVVAVDDVEVECVCQYAGYCLVVAYLLQ